MTAAFQDHPHIVKLLLEVLCWGWRGVSILCCKGEGCRYLFENGYEEWEAFGVKGRIE